MGKKTVYNINAMREVLINQHNSGNKKNITRDMLEGAGIQGEYFTYWQTSVEALRSKVSAYVNLSWNAKFDSKITKEQVAEAREAIYPAYKEILSQGEPDKETKKLKVDESDVERLIKFAWNFTNAAGATTMVNVEKKKFRLEVEKLMGCIIAKAEILSDEDRDKLTKYNKAAKAIEKAETRQAEIAEETEVLTKAFQVKTALLDELKIQGEKREALVKDIIDRLAKLSNEKKELDTKIAENNTTVNELSEDIKKIRNRVLFA